MVIVLTIVSRALLKVDLEQPSGSSSSFATCKIASNARPDTKGNLAMKTQSFRCFCSLSMPTKPRCRLEIYMAMVRVAQVQMCRYSDHLEVGDAMRLRQESLARTRHK